MAAPPPFNAIFLFPPKKTRRFEVDFWADYALRETSYALSTAEMINKVTHCKSTRDVAHEFPIVTIVDRVRVPENDLKANLELFSLSEFGKMKSVIRTKFVAVKIEGSAFTERSMFARQKMDVEGDIDAVSKLYDTKWAKCIEQARQRENTIYANEENVRARAEAENQLAREKERAEREKERAEREKERAERLEAELRALREIHGGRN
ncbi:hypothetical protein PILCRDRAFT_803066 [Piloderma croceum F 1598]|uniref:Uncharacterized protein n=1 Tax=Piloderma croceum (strain F 1598) TaxID=765440 RepID=A0A0C3B789_PILCF|nr:hypothetical protein PILCRDRAFT_803066 [Piloderma croceum F 1598]